MASRIAIKKASLSSLQSATRGLAPIRGRIDLELSQQDERNLRSMYGSEFQTSAAILDSVSSSSDAFPARLPGEFVAPELSDRAAISSMNVAEEWARVASYQAIFGSPNEFIARVRGLSLDTIGRLVRAQCPSLDQHAAVAVARRLLSSMSGDRGSCAASGPGADRQTLAANETNRQISSQVSHRAPKDYHAVWEGHDTQALEDLADMLGRAASSKHVAVVDALTRLAFADGMPLVGCGVQRHHLIRIRNRSRAVPAWAYDHTLMDQFDVLYWVLQPFIEATQRTEGRGPQYVPPIVPPKCVDERGGTTQVGWDDTNEVTLYMKKADAPHSGQFYIDGEPINKQHQTVRGHGSDTFPRVMSLLGANVDDFDVWAETHNGNSRRSVHTALNMALSRGVSALYPQYRPVIRWNHNLTHRLNTHKGTRPGFFGWARVRTVKKR